LNWYTFDSLAIHNKNISNQKKKK